MPFGGNLSFLPPELALEDKRLSRRQRIADLLLQQGLEPVENRQHGRFYVAPSPWQYAAQGAKALAGGYLSKKNDDASKEMVDRYQKLMADEIEGRVKELNSGAPAQPAVPGQAGNLEDLLAQTPPLGAAPSTPPGLDVSRPTVLSGAAAEGMPQGEGAGANVQVYKGAPGLTTTLPQTPPLQMPTPDQPAQPATGGQDPATRQRIIQELMLSRYNPQARALGQMLSQQGFQREERASREAFQEKELGVRLAETRQGRMDNLEAKRDALQAQVENYKRQSEDRNLSVEQRREASRQHDETVRQGQKVLAELATARLQGTQTRAQFQQASKLRAEYNADPNVKVLTAVEPITETLAPYMLDRASSSGAATAVGDNMLLRAYLASTRGDGERLTNMQLTEMAKLPGLGDRVTGWIQNLLVGKHLPDETAEEMWHVISAKLKSMEDQRMRRKVDILKRAEKAKLDLGLIFGEE